MDISHEFCKSLGDTEIFLGAYSKTLSQGPEDSVVRITIGNTPWNGQGVMLYIGEYGVLTNADSQEDVMTLIRLLNGGRMDHPYIEEYDCDEEDEDGI